MFKTILLAILTPFMIGPVVGLAMTGCVNDVFCHWHFAGKYAVNIFILHREWWPIICTVLTASSSLSLLAYIWLCHTNRVQHKTAGYKQSVIGMFVSMLLSVVMCAGVLQPNTESFGTGYYFMQFATDFSALATTCSMVTLALYTLFLHFRYKNSVRCKAA